MQNQQWEAVTEEPVYGAYSFMDQGFALLAKAFWRTAREDRFARLDYEVYGVLFELLDHREPDRVIVISQQEIADALTKVDQPKVARSLKKLKNAKLIYSVRQAKLRVNPSYSFSGKAKEHTQAIDTFNLLITPEPMKVTA
ncbi:hypothetical protein [Streptomyces sp. NPDC088762]|uniref:hypothetical protein n=1 Tax=Streptomyces sp. NPDC088762 TaxID=3365891 RepID=UPI00382988B4